MIRKWQSGLSDRSPGGRRGTGARSGGRRRTALALEGLEDRILLSGLTCIVDRITDTGAGSGTNGDLRYGAHPGRCQSRQYHPVRRHGHDLAGSPLPDITADLTINGPGASNLTVLGYSFSRVFFINGSFTVGISGLTITNGAVTGAKGGITNNRGTLTITACTFAGNSAENGGAIENLGLMTVADSSFIGNTASAGSGAIWNEGTLTVTDSTFSNNSSNVGGGAIVNGLQLTVSGCTFNGNHVDQTGLGRGGAIQNHFATATITNSTFVNNSATLGGGLDNYAVPAPLSVGRPSRH